MNNEDKQTLINDIKNDLDIKWNDEATNKKIAEYVDNGMQAIISIACNKEIDFTKPGKERELLFSYCRYARSNVLEMFKLNYKDDIISLRLKYQTAGVE